MTKATQAAIALPARTRAILEAAEGTGGGVQAMLQQQGQAINELIEGRGRCSTCRPTGHWRIRGVGFAAPPAQPGGGVRLVG